MAVTDDSAAGSQLTVIGYEEQLDINTWNMAVESNLNPSDPGCLMRGKADGSSTASAALKLTSPNVRAWVSG